MQYVRTAILAIATAILFAIPIHAETLQPAQGTGTARDGRTPEPPPGTPAISTLTIKGKHVYIVCFYGPSDHDGVAKKECARMTAECGKRYGAKFCHQVNNPTQERLTKLKDEGLVVVVTHSTPDPSEECGYDVWDSDLTPSQIAACFIDTPVVWFGCFGQGISDGKNCQNIIPLDPVNQVLHSGKPEVWCRFRATMACLEEFSGTGVEFTQADVEACVLNKLKTMSSYDPSCK